MTFFNIKQTVKSCEDTILKPDKTVHARTRRRDKDSEGVKRYEEV